jgi:hypothetical protein
LAIFHLWKGCHISALPGHGVQAFRAFDSVQNSQVLKHPVSAAFTGLLELQILLAKMAD